MVREEKIPAGIYNNKRKAPENQTLNIAAIWLSGAYYLMIYLTYNLSAHYDPGAPFQPQYPLQH